MNHGRKKVLTGNRGAAGMDEGLFFLLREASGLPNPGRLPLIARNLVLITWRNRFIKIIRRCLTWVISPQRLRWIKRKSGKG